MTDKFVHGFIDCMAMDPDSCCYAVVTTEAGDSIRMVISYSKAIDLEGRIMCKPKESYPIIMRVYYEEGAEYPVYSWAHTVLPNEVYDRSSLVDLWDKRQLLAEDFDARRACEAKED